MRRRQVWPWAAAAAVALAFGTGTTAAVTRGGQPAAGADRWSASPSFVVSGAVVIADSNGGSFRRDGCAGTGDHANIHDGAPVVVFAAARSSAVGRLTDGRALMDGTCRYWFAVTEVATGLDHYYLQVSDRGGALYSEADLKGTLVTIRLSG